MVAHRLVSELTKHFEGQLYPQHFAQLRTLILWTGELFKIQWIVYMKVQ